MLYPSLSTVPPSSLYIPAPNLRRQTLCGGYWPPAITTWRKTEEKHPASASDIRGVLWADLKSFQTSLLSDAYKSKCNRQ